MGMLRNNFLSPRLNCDSAEPLDHETPNSSVGDALMFPLLNRTLDDSLKSWDASIFFIHYV